MAPPKFSMTWSLGNLLQITSLVVACAVGWTLMDARSQANTDQLLDIKRDSEGLEGRVRYLERQEARSDERYQSIISILSEIKIQIERLTNDPRD